MKTLRVGAPRADLPHIDLGSLGFRGCVSQKAREEIRDDERRAQRVISTAHHHWFAKTTGSDNG